MRFYGLDPPSGFVLAPFFELVIKFDKPAHAPMTVCLYQRIPGACPPPYLCRDEFGTGYEA